MNILTATRAPRPPAAQPARWRAIPIGLGLLLTFLASCTTERNPAFCCSDPADCSRFGVTEDKLDCAAGLTCVGHTCVSTACASAADCGPTAPVCDANACRACKLDAECPSGACADDGSCAPEEEVVYLDPQGQDIVPCSKERPCRDLRFGIQQTHRTRTHVVLARGSYTAPANPLSISSQATTAPRLSIHGGGSVVTGGSGDGFLSISIPTALRDLELVNPTPTEGGVIGASDSVTIEHAMIRGYVGIANFAHLQLSNTTIKSVDRGIRNSGTLTIDRAMISGGTVGIESTSGTVTISNLLVFGTSGVGLDFNATGGSVAFSTIVDTGNTGIDTPGVRCLTTPLTIRATVIWTPASPLRAGVEGGCTLISSLAGPVGVPGALNANPVFVNPLTGDYHLSGGSPARDMVDVGPPTDFEGDSRPLGLRFDMGADETP